MWLLGSSRADVYKLALAATMYSKEDQTHIVQILAHSTFRDECDQKTRVRP